MTAQWPRGCPLGQHVPSFQFKDLGRSQHPVCLLGQHVSYFYCNSQRVSQPLTFKWRSMTAQCPLLANRATCESDNKGGEG